MSQYDVIYNGICQDIIERGYSDKDQDVRTVWADGEKAYTKSILNEQFTFDNTEVPILTTKKVAWKTAIKELLWIWQMKSNNVKDLQAMGVNIWNEWMQSDETIGKAYGYQLGKKCRGKSVELRGGIGNRLLQQWDYKIDQVDYLLEQLVENPSSRRHITTLWDADDLDDMALTPCVWNTHWMVKNQRLHLKVGIRSNDIALGQPFNVFQYYVLQRMIAQVTGHELGTLTFNIDDCHMYSRHEAPIKEQIQRETFEAPELWINPDVTNFYNFTIDDFKLIDYKHGDPIKMEVAI